MIEVERRKRINVALWAYAYEIMDDPLVSDAKYDATCREVRPDIATGHEVMDAFFREVFDPSTGMWIYKHPEVMRLAAIYQRLTGKPAKHVSPFASESPPVTAQVSGMGFKTQTEMKWYLARLGFRVVPHWSQVGDRWCETVFDKECAYITDVGTKEQITVFYRDVFRPNSVDTHGEAVP